MTPEEVFFPQFSFRNDSSTGALSGVSHNFQNVFVSLLHGGFSGGVSLLELK